MQANIIQLYQQVFGYKGVPVWPISTSKMVAPADDATVNDFAQEAKYSDLSGTLGVRYFMPTKIDGLWLPNEPLVSVSGQNMIVKTQLTGVRGLVKELISTDDYAIKIEGLIINESSDDYPEEYLRKIRTICEKPAAVEIDNRLLTLFDIHQVAIESYSFPGVAGDQNVQAYVITCSSDRPIELLLKQS